MNHQCFRIQWNFIMAKLGERILEKSLLEQPVGQLLRTEVHVVSDSVLRVLETTTPFRIRHGRHNFLKYRTRRHSWTNMMARQTSATPLAHIFRTQSDPNQERNSNTLGIRGTL